MFMGCGCHCKEDSVSVSTLDSRFSVSGSFLGSTSISDSQASGYRPPYDNPVAGCVACRDTVAPVFYDVNWNYNGEPMSGLYANRECCGQYNAVKTARCKRIDVGRPQFIFETNCVWVSDVPALSSRMDFTLSPFNPQRGCDVATSVGVTAPRFTIAIPSAKILGLTGIEDPAVIVRYEQNIKLFGGGQFIGPGAFYAVYYYVPPNGEDWRVVGVRCLQQMTFRLGHPTAPNIEKRWLNSFYSSQFRTWYGSPCKQSQFGGLDPGLPEFLTVTPVPA
jgi:hypothetical protein